MEPFIKLVRAVTSCYTFGDLYSISEEFSKHGLALVETNGGNYLLCRVENGQPIAENIIDDYIFAGSSKVINDRIPADLKECIIKFVEENRSGEAVKQVPRRSWTANTSVFGPPLFVKNEDMQQVMFNMAINENSTVGKELLSEVKRWLNASI